MAGAMMSSFVDEPGKAAGTSDPRRRRNTTDSGVQPHGSNEWPEAPSSYAEEHGLRNEGRRHAQRSANRRHTTSANTTRRPQGTRPQSAPQPSRADSDDWDLVEDDEVLQESSTSPTYDFPGTWGAALHDTSAALSQVRTASTSYASALSSSGLGRAGRSIGAALWSTTNKSAVAVAGWAVEQSGTDVRELPGPVRSWLSGGRRGGERRRAGERRAAVPHREPLTFGDEKGAFVLETREMDSTGDFIGEGREDDEVESGEEEEDDE